MLHAIGIERRAERIGRAINHQRRPLLGGQRERDAVVYLRDVDNAGELLDKGAALIDERSVFLSAIAGLRQLAIDGRNLLRDLVDFFHLLRDIGIELLSYIAQLARRVVE